jgi:hypothetical protein
VNGNGRDAFAGNVIPADRISPIAQKLLGVHPAAQHRPRRVRPEQLHQAQTREKTTDGFDAR